MAKEPNKKAVKKTIEPSTVKKTVTKKVAVRKAAAKQAVVKETAPKKAVLKEAAPKKVAVKKTARKAAAPKADLVVTTVIAKIDAGFGNQITIRGGDAGLSWENGLVMENAGADEWVWKSSALKSELEFKVLLNDEIWSTGPNGVVFPGATVVFEPAF